MTDQCQAEVQAQFAESEGIEGIAVELVAVAGQVAWIVFAELRIKWNFYMVWIITVIRLLLAYTARVIAVVLIVIVLIVTVLIVTVLAVVAQAVVVPTARPATVAEPGLDQGKPFERTLQMEFQPVAQQLSPSCIVYISMSPFLRKKKLCNKEKSLFLFNYIKSYWCFTWKRGDNDRDDQTHNNNNMQWKSVTHFHNMIIY